VTLPSDAHPPEQDQPLGEGRRCQETEGDRVRPEGYHIRGTDDDPAARSLQRDAVNELSDCGIEAGVRLEVVPVEHGALEPAAGS